MTWDLWRIQRGLRECFGILIRVFGSIDCWDLNLVGIYPPRPEGHPSEEGICVRELIARSNIIDREILYLSNFGSVLGRSILGILSTVWWFPLFRLRP